MVFSSFCVDIEMNLLNIRDFLKIETGDIAPTYQRTEGGSKTCDNILSSNVLTLTSSLSIQV